ncbi:MAG TPA: AMP-binding protein [Ramlibacter sp.]|nr:AMP-binding protein [Ramlibacter sp.]
MGRWDDKFARAERKWSAWQMPEYAQADRVLHRIIEDKARRKPQRVVFQFGERPVTLEELHLAVNRVANGFLALGLRPGQNVALLLPNCAEFLYAWFGLNRCGAASVPVNVAHRGEGLAWQLDQSDATAVVVHADLLQHLVAIADRLPKLRHVVVLGGPAPAAPWPGVVGLGFAQLCSRGEATPDIAVPFNALATISYTSGTTGPSKGVMYSHHYWYEVWAGAARHARYTDEDVLYTGLPFFHTSAHGMTGPAILVDARAVLVERFSASRMLDDCRRWGCTSAKYIGSIIPILMKQEARPDDADNPLRVLVGSAAPRELWQPFQDRFNTRLLELYGMTECSTCLINPYDARRPGSCGQAITGYDVRVVDEFDNELPPGTVGEIVARPQRAFLGTTGYYRNPEATLELFRNFWIHTGDLGRMDEDGYFHFVDRRKQAIRRRGENISSFEVEAVINAHPAVLESCVVGVPSELGEEEVKAVVVLRPGQALSAEDLVNWCEPRMAYFAVPRYVEFRAALPKTASERVEKYRLKAEGVTADTWDRLVTGRAPWSATRQAT